MHKSNGIYNNFTDAVPLLRPWFKCMKTAVNLIWGLKTVSNPYPINFADLPGWDRLMNSAEFVQWESMLPSQL
jgi:hypothetical protein